MILTRLHFALLLSICATPLFGDANSDRAHAEHAVALVRQGQLDDALRSLQKIPAESELQPWALHEAMKVLYGQQRWTQFFGLASFAREHYPISDMRDEMQLLEILALLRHCQKDPAVDLVRRGLTESLPASRSRYETLASLLEVAPVSPDEAPPENTKPLEAEKAAEKQVFKGRNVWRIPVKSVQKLNPWKMQRKVEPKCEASQ